MNTQATKIGIYDVRDIANFTLDYAESKGLPITNLSLQKLIYFLHGWFSAIYLQPLIKNKFEAWQYGPVQKVLYDQFRAFGNAKIKENRAKYLNPLTGNLELRGYHIESDHADLISIILDQYLGRTASSLVTESHVEDGPWEYVWKQAEQSVYPGMKIPDELIVDHFKRIPSKFTMQ